MCVVLLAMWMVGCDDGFSVRWTRLAELPPGAGLGARSLSLPVETTVSARATVIDGGRELSCAPQMESEDPDTLFVEPSERGAFVFIGVAPGETALRISCGKVVFDLVGSVTERDRGDAALQDPDS